MSVAAETTLRLSPLQKQSLLRAGRSAMEAAVRRVAPPAVVTNDPFLRRPSGAFVTLTSGGDLRGCIGFFEPLHPLVETVQRSAVKAALDDHRFPPISVQELPAVRLQVSVLSGKTPVESMEEISVGRDGLYLETSAARGLLLPQVASEYRWDAETYLQHVFMKCGLLPSPLGSPGISLFRFTAEVFSEDAILPAPTP